MPIPVPPTKADGEFDVIKYLYSQKLDKSLLQLDAEELAWFKEATRIEDEAELKDHICSVQSEAFAVFPYPCIKNFNFTKLKISRLPAYPQVLKLSKTRPDAILLDLGCCFGNDARKAILDGYPAQNVICSDLRKEYWDLGFKLFRDKEGVDVPFIAGDVFDPAFLSPTRVPRLGSRPSLKNVKTLTELQGSISVIHASSFFHLFDKEGQESLAHLVASLLSPEPGSVAFGSHTGALDPATRNRRGSYAHNAETWTKLWESVVGKGTYRIAAELIDRGGRDQGPDTMIVTHTLTWSITKL